MQGGVKLSVVSGSDVVTAPAIVVLIGNRPVPTIAPPTGGTSFSAGALITAPDIIAVPGAHT